MASVDFGRYKRIVQAFWDPEPLNDDTSRSPIWCLGREYESRSLLNGVSDSSREAAPDAASKDPAVRDGVDIHRLTERLLLATTNGSQADEQGTPGKALDRGWPPDFLDDCESRVWFTYRSNFPPIKKSSDASMTLSVRLRSLGDQGGFTSDTGWGCMIRSGQSLLANALMILRLGRGRNPTLQTRCLC